MKFYTDVFLQKNTIFCRGYEDGKRFELQEQLAPYVFLLHEAGEFRTLLDNKKATKVTFKSMDDFWQFKMNNPGLPIHGNLNFLYQYINDAFPADVTFDVSLLSKVTIDIEVMSSTGFPDPHKAEYPIVTITLTKNKKTYVWGFKELREPKDFYIRCVSEEDLLRKFIKTWKALDPDIVTGWNIDGFDIPYIVNRIRKVLGNRYVNDLSPWRLVYEKDIKTKWHGEIKQYGFHGLTIMDYFPLYKKFTQNAEESYTLNHIAQVTIGEKKIDYAEHGSLNALYENDFDKFIEYNVYDCVLVDKIEARLGYINQATTMAYNAKVNFVDVFGTVKPWDIIITNELLRENVVVPQREEKEERRIMGGWNKPPQTGFHKWIVTYDFKSLYPHIIMACNISPEMFAKKIDDVTIEGLLKNGTEGFRDPDYCLTAAGCLFERQKLGILPRLMEKFINIRNESKKKLKIAKFLYQQEPSEKLMNEITQYDNQQKAAKVFINGDCRWFPPGVPQGLVVAGFPVQGADTLAADLVWQPDAENDLAGYNVYRQTLTADGSAAGSVAGPAVKLNAALVGLPSFHDATVARGVTYRYTVTAVDSKGNESAASAVADLAATP